jgi:signal transduction histidine kinase
MKKALNNAAIFVMTYIVFMLPTYFLPYLRTSSSAFYGFEDAASANAFNYPFFIHLACMIILCWICYVRGAMIGKSWLFFLPMVAFAFEFISKLSAIPYVPSMYHVLAIVVGATSANVLVSTDKLTT